MSYHYCPVGAKVNYKTLDHVPDLHQRRFEQSLGKELNYQRTYCWVETVGIEETKEKYAVLLLLKLAQISVNSYLRDFPVDLDRASHEDSLCRFVLHCYIWNPCCSRRRVKLKGICLALDLAWHHFRQVLA